MLLRLWFFFFHSWRQRTLAQQAAREERQKNRRDVSWSGQGLEKCLKENSADWYWEYRNLMECNSYCRGPVWQKYIFPLWHTGNNFSCLCSNSLSGNGIVWCSLLYSWLIRTSPTGIQVLAQVLSTWGLANPTLRRGTSQHTVAASRLCWTSLHSMKRESVSCSVFLGLAWGKRWVPMGGWCLQLLWWQLTEILLWLLPWQSEVLSDVVALSHPPCHFWWCMWAAWQP